MDDNLNRKLTNYSYVIIEVVRLKVLDSYKDAKVYTTSSCLDVVQSNREALYHGQSSDISRPFRLEYGVYFRGAPSQ